MGDVQPIVTLILEIAAFISAIGLAWTYIKKWSAETKGSKNSELINEHAEQLKRINERVTVLESKDKRQDQFVSAMCSAMLALLDHNINGNSIDKLKDAKEEMQEFLIHRG